MLVLGCDLSLVATGLVVWDTEAEEVFAYELVRTKPNKEDPGDLMARTHHQWLRVRYWVKRTEGICLEALAFGASHGDSRPVTVYSVVTYRLWRANLLFTTVPSTTVKKHATGKGRATKREMEEAAALEGFVPDAPRSLANNVVDAYWVARWYTEVFLG